MGVHMFFPEVEQGQPGMAEHHAGSGAAHDSYDFLFHVRFVAVDRAL